MFRDARERQGERTLTVSRSSSSPAATAAPSLSLLSSVTTSPFLGIAGLRGTAGDDDDGPAVVDVDDDGFEKKLSRVDWVPLPAPDVDSFFCDDMIRARVRVRVREGESRDRPRERALARRDAMGDDLLGKHSLRLRSKI